MPLPKPTLPIYNTKVPSTGKAIRYRPFTVREEKALALAMQSDDLKVIINSIELILRECIEGLTDKELSELALFDIEFLMTQVRARSVGEKIDLVMACEKDPEHEKTPVQINLDDLQVKFHEGHLKEIPLFGDVGICMRYPTVKDMVELVNKEDEKEIDKLESILSCISYIWDKDEIYDVKEQSREELLEFLNNLTEKHIEKIQECFFAKLPVFEYTIKYNCKQCGHGHNVKVKGLSNFFF